MPTVRTPSPDSERDLHEAGAILVFTAFVLVILLGMIGLTIDLGHAYVNKSQLQNIADACALAGASALNNTVAGIQEAENRATDISGKLANEYEFDSHGVSIPASAVSYSADLNGEYIDKAAAQAIADTIRFVRVVVPNQPSGVFFASVIPGIPKVMSFGAEAVAGQIPLSQVCTGLDPFCARPIYPGEPAYYPGDPFGYEPGRIYEVRVPGGNSGAGEKSCADYGIPGSITGNFGLADPANGGPGTETFRHSIGYGATGYCVQMGLASLPDTPGLRGEAVLAPIIERFTQDPDQNPYFTYIDYLAHYAANNDLTNYRRILRIPFNDGEYPEGHSGPYAVTGFGCFFMSTKPAPGNPSNAICLMYVGQCSNSGEPTGGRNPSITKLVLFR